MLFLFAVQVRAGFERRLDLGGSPGFPCWIVPRVPFAVGELQHGATLIRPLRGVLFAGILIAPFDSGSNETEMA